MAIEPSKQFYNSNKRMKYKFKTRWLKQKEYEALEKVVAYLDDERKDYRARTENGEPTRKHIGKAVKILAAYVDEIGGSLSAISSPIGDKIKRDAKEGRPCEGLPDEMAISCREPHQKRARPSVKAYCFAGER